MNKQLRKILEGVLAVATLCIATPINDIYTNPLALKANFTASAEAYGSYGDLTYKIDDGEITITYCNESATEVVIPSEIEGLPVTVIGDRAFGDCSYLTSIEIPDSVINIGSSAFISCISLTSIIIPDSVTIIEHDTFCQCISLTSIILPDSLIIIDWSAFIGCSNLKSITIPASVTNIGGNAFWGCSKLTSISVDEGNQDYFDIDGVLFDKDKKALIKYPSGKTSSEYEIPNFVTEIDRNAFSDSDLISIIIPDSVTSINATAFGSCYRLNMITIPASVTYIAGDAFEWCSTLNSIYVDENNEYYSDIDGVLFNKDKTTLVTYPRGKTSTEYEIPNSVTNIGYKSFYYCSQLTSITIPDSVESIGISAFYNCSSLISVTIPNLVTSIESSTFSSCSNLTSITISASVKRISTDAFDLCLSLTSIMIDENNQHYSDIDGVLFNKDKTLLIRYPIGKPLPSYKVPDSVTNISWRAFANCYNLISITIPDSVINIGDWAFDYICIKTIYGYTGSYAETYANEKGITFIALDAELETGDLSGNGDVDSDDIVILKKAIYGKKALSPNQAIAADINGDGKINVFDLTLLKRNIKN